MELTRVLQSALASCNDRVQMLEKEVGANNAPVHTVRYRLLTIDVTAQVQQLRAWQHTVLTNIRFPFPFPPQAVQGNHVQNGNASNAAAPRTSVPTTVIGNTRVVAPHEAIPPPQMPLRGIVEGAGWLYSTNAVSDSAVFRQKKVPCRTFLIRGGGSNGGGTVIPSLFESLFFFDVCQVLPQIRRLMPQAQNAAQAAKAAAESVDLANRSGGDAANAHAAVAAANKAATELENDFWRALQDELLANFQRTQKHLYFVVSAPTARGQQQANSFASRLHWERIQGLIHSISQAWSASQTRQYEVGACAQLVYFTSV